MIIRSFLIFYLLTCYSCMNAQPSYEYADGNGNTYLLTSSSLEYAPVTPERSSSGNYSGGAPKKVHLERDAYVRLTALMEKAIANTDAHQVNREMMTGLIIAPGPSESRRIVLKKNSTEKKEIEDALREQLGI
jgi:hypothetical protein